MPSQKQLVVALVPMEKTSYHRTSGTGPVTAECSARLYRDSAISKVR
jgi:hypothetical protein